MPRVVVIHRDPAEAAEQASRLCDADLLAEPYPVLGPKGFRELRANPPDAIVIDLMRTPSYGRSMGALIRESKSLRSIPLVFVEGDPSKTRATKQVLPDAVYTPWAKLRKAIGRAIERAPERPSLPRSARTVAEKLGIENCKSLKTINFPKECMLELPPGPLKSERADDAEVLMVWARSEAVLSRELPAAAKWISKGRRLWLLWPKKASGVKTTLTMPRVRELATAHGLIDYKVCAVDETWSAMAVGPRRRAT
jgi:hypothetical protein